VLLEFPEELDPPVPDEDVEGGEAEEELDDPVLGGGGAAKQAGSAYRTSDSL